MMKGIELPSVLLILILFLIALIIGIGPFNEAKKLTENKDFTKNTISFKLNEIDPVPISKTGDGNPFTYDFEFEFSAQIGEFDNNKKIEILPLIRFKNVLVKPKINRADENFFSVELGTEFNRRLSAVVNSSIPFVEEKENPFYGDITAGQSFLMRDKGDFLIGLQIPIEDDFISTGTTAHFDSSCKHALFSVECADSKTTVRLENWESCEAPDFNKCQKSLLNFCGGEVFIKMGKLEEDLETHWTGFVSELKCLNKVTDVTIEVSGGKDFSEQSFIEIGNDQKLTENFELFFFRYSDCAEKYETEIEKNNYNLLFQSCPEDLLSSHLIKAYVS